MEVSGQALFCHRVRCHRRDERAKPSCLGVVRRYKERVTGFDCIVALKALGEETRLRMLRLLINSQLRVNEISEKLGVSQYNVSKHLRIMREAGWLETERDGKQRFNTASDLKG